MEHWYKELTRYWDLEIEIWYNQVSCIRHIVQSINQSVYRIKYNEDPVLRLFRYEDLLFTLPNSKYGGPRRGIKLYMDRVGDFFVTQFSLIRCRYKWYSPQLKSATKYITFAMKKIVEWGCKAVICLNTNICTYKRTHNAAIDTETSLSTLLTKRCTWL